MNTNVVVGNELKDGVVVTWFVGISLSTVCLIVQLLLVYFIPKIRKANQKILIQLSVARLVNTIVEYLNADTKRIGNNSLLKTVLTTLYAFSDIALVCWMFVYTKNIYDKVVQVFNLQKWSVLRLALIIWPGSLPVGLLYPLLINLAKAEQYHKVYSVIKFIVLIVNMFCFSKIFYVIATKQNTNSKSLRRIIKTCVILFLLVCITSLQVALTDLFSFYTKNSTVAIVFCLINSFQVLAISIIFGILSKNLINT